MKTSKYNRSEIMKKAWTLFKKYESMFITFGRALERAWLIAKDSIAYEAKKDEARLWEERRSNSVNTQEGSEYPSEAKILFMERLYTNGAYSGD